MKINVSFMVLALFFLSMFMLTSTCANAEGVKTQLCLVIDGSNSITDQDWTIITRGIADAIRNDLPHDGSVELTVVQFGYFPEYARTEVSPTVITDANFRIMANTVGNLTQSKGDTPTPHGLLLGWNEIKSSSNFPTAAKQVINLATDGEANIRNNKATTDLDGDGFVNEFDDMIAVVNNAKIEGLDELDIEGIAITDTQRDWYKNWTLVPQPGIIAPPFSKPGWIRIVANAMEFANTLDQKLQAIITEEKVFWTPTVEEALVAGAFTVGVTGVVSSLASSIGNPSSIFSAKISEILPEVLERWLHEFIHSKHKLIIEQKMGALFMLTRQEMFSFIMSFSALTFAYSYVEAGTLNEILPLIPIVLAISIFAEFFRFFVIKVVAKSQGFWSEFHLSYFGLGTLLISALVFGVPFSWPSHTCHRSPKFTRRSLGLVSFTEVIVILAFSAIFYGLFVNGFALVGSIGLIMCFIFAFLNSIPIPPMNGKDIYDWSKVLWITLFITTFTLYMLYLLLL